MNKGNIRAFSITEVLVSLVVSAIIVGITFVLFEILSERMYDFRDQNIYISDLNRFTYSINKDMFDSDKLSGNNETLIFTMYSGGRIEYRRQQDYVVRSKEEFIDTFRLSVGRLTMDTITNGDKNVIYQRLKIDVRGGESDYNLRFFKKVYSESLMAQGEKQ